MGATEVARRLDDLLTGLVSGTHALTTDVDASVRPQLDDLLSEVSTYRDAALIVLAYAVDAGTTERVTIPPPGRRTVAQKLASLLDVLHIRARRDAFQTLAKGSDSLLGRDKASWNQLLLWTQEQRNMDLVEQAMGYLASGIALTARDLPPMPILDIGRLTFHRAISVADELLDQPSGGAHEQFIFASLLHAVAEQQGGGLRVDTKNLNAADAPARTAGDVQLWLTTSTPARALSPAGGQLVDAYEVTANRWDTKIAQATTVLVQNDLRRIHIVARGPAPSAADIRNRVGATALPAGMSADQVDISVLDVRAECRSLLHRLHRPGRRSALEKLWEHLVIRQPNDALVPAYVTLLHAAAIVADD